MMRAEVSRGLRSLREVNADGRGFPLNRDYLYGSYFFLFLRERYGDKAIRAFIDNYSGNVVPFRVQSNPVAETGKPMDELWVEYQNWLRARFAPQASDFSAGEVLVRAFSLSSPVLTNSGTRWYVQGDGYTRPQLMRQAPGEKPRALRATEPDTRLAPAADEGVLMAQLEICRNHNLLYDLHHVDSLGRRSKVTDCERHRFAAPLESGRIAAVRVDAGEAEVVVLEPGKPTQTLYRSAPVRGELLLTTIEADGGALRLQRLPPEPLERREIRVEERGIGAPSDAVVAHDRPYSPWPSIRPTAWAPLVQIADGAVALGAIVYGQDALELHQYLLAPMVELTQGELLGRAEYVYDGRHGVVANRTLTVRASESGSTKSHIKAYSIKQNGQWVSLWRDLALNRRWYWGLGGAIEEEDFHDLAAGTSRVQNERVVGLVGGFDSRRQQWLSEGPSQGHELRLFAETSRGLGADFGGNVYRADWRGHLPLGKTVLALRWNEAYGQRQAERFELGGSKSDDYILLPELNQRDFALRGYTTGTS